MLTAIVIAAFMSGDPCSWMPPPAPPGTQDTPLYDCIYEALIRFGECRFECGGTNPPDPACCQACIDQHWELRIDCFEQFPDAYTPSSRSLTMPGCVFVPLK